MAIYTVQDTTMTALGDAIRKQKFGTTDIVENHTVNLTADNDIIDVNVKFPNFKVIVNSATIITGSGGWVNFYVNDNLMIYPNDSFPKSGQATNMTSLKLRIIAYYCEEATINFTIVPTDEDGNEIDQYYTPAEMVDEIDGLICLTEDDLIFTNAQSLNYNGIWDNIFSKIGNHIVLKNCYGLSSTFYGSKLEDLSMITIDGGYNKLNATFQNCSNLKYLPTVKSYRCWSLYDTFAGCNRLRSLGNFFDNITIENNRDTTVQWGRAFENCYSLRTIPQKVSNALWNGYYYYYGSVYYRCFRYCYALDEIIGLGVDSSYFQTPTANFFQNTFDNCYRLKNMTFLTNEDGTPISSDLINQTIDLSGYVGYGSSESYILNYNSGITADKKVYDDATYASLKDDPDWYSLDINYSRYNHDSAVNTINSLPDVSAEGTNTIKFKGQSGALTDGGAINTLTEEEIAVASAKGWTVSLA